eukprot:CAMPEP_0184381262 /NCGR_PEP_ID=MMETSP0007-20130409/5388_1 /TAXON_ID=97485 /ORGANISM="Prymnesium parvum, Strain Texoma1" /LENGTH=82 /DNA_ID=CAMNT_0026726813 /DNA_START=407 /DNA_END=652 /DNA_ORIENTATION=+
MDEASRTEASLERVLLPFARAEACSAPAAWMRDELVRSSRSDARRNVRAASLVLRSGRSPRRSHNSAASKRRRRDVEASEST